MNPLLEIENITVSYPGKTVLTGVSFSAYPGELISVTGPNGSGKTALIKTAAKIIKPDNGNIYFKGLNIKKISNRTLAKKIALTGQSSEIPPMRVEDYVLLGRLPFFKKYQFFETAKDIAIAREYMRLTGILPLEDKSVDEISEGERQLASIARALCQAPELLLLDEPTSNLDIARQLQMLELICRLKKKLSLAVLIVIHDLNLAAEYSDRIIMLNGKKGKIHVIGTPEEALTRESISRVYNVNAMISKNPVSGRPRVFINR